MGAIHNVFFAGLFGLCCFGYGRLVGVWIHPRLLVFSSLTILLGLGVLAFIGGVLNLLHLAGPMSLMGLLAVGTGMSLRTAWRIWRGADSRGKGNADPTVLRRVRDHATRNGLILAAWLVAASMSLILSPSTTFNLHDDFHTYLVRPLRMLATGSVAGNPFDQLGLDGLGTGSFFQAFFVADFDIRKIHGFDAVFCFGLCLMMLAETCSRWRISRWIGAVSMACFVSINPQAVNVSPLFAGSAAILGLTISLIVVWRVLADSASGRSAFRCWFPLALLISLTASLKVTVFVATAWLIIPVWIVGWFKQENKGRWLGRGAGCAIATMVLLSPWILNVIPAILKARQAAAPCLSQATLRDHFSSLSAGEGWGLLSTTTLYYGNKVTDYHILMMLVLLAGAWCVFASKSRRPAVRHPGKVIVGMILGPASLATTISFTHIFGLQTGIRYVCPMLLATGPMALLVCASVVTKSFRLETRRHSLQAIACAGLAVVAIFFTTAFSRFHRAFKYKTLIAYPIGPADAEYSLNTFSLGEAMRMRGLQGTARPGEIVLAWTVAPFRFDMAAGRIFSLSLQGFINPLIDFPAGISPADFRDYLLRAGVDIVIVEKQGGPLWTADELRGLLKKPLIIERKLGEFGLYARQVFHELATICRIRFEDDRFIVMDITGGTKVRVLEPGH